MIVFLLLLGVTLPIILEVHRKLPNKLLAKSEELIQPPYLNIKLSFLAGVVFSWRLGSTHFKHSINWFMRMISSS